MHSAILAIIICFLFGFGTFGTTPLLNSKVILSAHEAPLLASTLAASVFNIANFLGALWDQYYYQWDSHILRLHLYQAGSLS